MPKQSSIRVNLGGIDDLSQALRDTYVTRVGILGSKVERHSGDTSITNSEIGLIQEIGSYSKNIPARSFLRMPLTVKRPELIKALGATSVRAAFRAGDFRRVFALLGVKAEDIVQQAFETRGFGQWAPNAPATVEAKGSDKPLIDIGELRRAVTSDVKGRNEV